MDDDFSRVMKVLGLTDPQRSEELFPLVYDELRQLAARCLASGGPVHTYQPTALVHEAWLHLAGDRDYDWSDRAHFFRVAAKAMRRILVDRIREKNASKRGGGTAPINIEDVDLAATTRDERLLLIDESLDRLEMEDPEGAKVVMLKFFGGLTEAEIAQVQGVSERSVRRQWAYAKARLHQLIKQGQLE